MSLLSLTIVLLASQVGGRIAWSADADQPQPRPRVMLPRGFDLQAHRGARDARAENTLPAFAYALALGVTTLEVDMQITADGIPVISHHKDLRRYLAKNPWGKFLASDEQPDIRFTTLAALQQFDLGAMSPDAPWGQWDLFGKTQKPIPGTRIATLEDVFKLVKDWGNDKVFISVETKSTPYVINPGNPSPEQWVKAFYDLVVKYGMHDRVMLQSFDWRTLRVMKRVDPRIATVALTANQPSWNSEDDEGDYLWLDRATPSPWLAGLDLKHFGNDPVKAAHAIGADVYSPYYRELTPQLIKQAHALGMRVVPYTVNDPEQMRALIAMGVDGLLTDRPALLRSVMQELGMPLPPKDPNPKGKPYFTGIEAR